VAVLVEQFRGSLAEISFEMLALGRRLAQAQGAELVAVLLGGAVRPLVEELGAADRVALVEDEALAHYTPEAYERAAAAALGAIQPRLLLVASSTMGLDLAAGLAGRLGWPLCAYCRDVVVEGGRVVARSQIYGGKLVAEAVAEAPQVVCAVLPGGAPAAEGRRNGAPPVEALSLPPLPAARVRFRRLIEPEAGDVDITREGVLVSVGRGIQSADNLPMLEDLARALGGAVAASRPVVDQGWLPKSRQVGKSGLAVRPRLYLAVGISGAPEHLEGMRGAELIVAINTDRNAPIFDVAHYGVVGDLFDVVPLLTERLQGG
jgi:electron transfer flavoprotein alpha subunit